MAQYVNPWFHEILILIAKSKGSGFFGSKKTKVDKDMIGLPSNFQHVASIRYDPKTGFDVCVLHNLCYFLRSEVESVPSVVDSFSISHMI